LPHLWKLVILPLSIAAVVAVAAAQQGAVVAGGSPAANPGRPTVATPATLTPVGYLQFENGLEQAWRSPEFTIQLSFDETVKLAVAPRLQLLAITEPVARSKADGKLSTDPGGISMGGQAVFHEGAGANPTLAVSYLRQVYGGSAPDLDLGSAVDSLTLLASADVWGFHYDANAFFNRESQDDVNRAQFGQSLSVAHPVGKRFSVAGEVWQFTQPFLHSHTVGNLWAVAYTQRPNLVWDCAFNRGLTDTSTRWEVLAGFTYLLPHRLWR
jgi:hypothetical protein